MIATAPAGAATGPAMEAAMTESASHPAPRAEPGTAATIRVWDPLVRVSHWSLVGAFATAWLTADELQPVHEVAGYAIAALVAARLVWALSAAAMRVSPGS